MPVFASDMVSSVAYAPDEILLALSLSGLVALTVSPWIGLAVGAVILVIVLCYRLNLRAYPSGGGDYAVASTNLGTRAGLLVAASLLVDFVLTVAVSMTVFAGYIGAMIPELKPHKVVIAVGGIVLVTLAGLRGSASIRRFLAIPTYLFILAVFATVAVGTYRVVTGDTPVAATSGYSVLPMAEEETALMGLAAVFIILRAFSSGSVALAGVQTVAMAVPGFRAPRGRNAAATLLLTGALSACMLVGLTWLSAVIGIKYVAAPSEQLVARSGSPIGADFEQDPVLGQLAQAVFSGFPFMFYVVAAVAALVLLVAANTSVEGFPGLASRLARDGFLPRQLASRGDRLTFSNGILLLAAAAAVLVVAFRASVPDLIELYLVGVFTAFVLGQLGMIRHWTVRIRRIVSSPVRRRMQLNRVVNGLGFVLTALVLVVVLVTKLAGGAWIAVAAIAVLYLVMGLIHRHYTRVDSELAPDEDDESARTLPPNTHAVVVVTEIHKPMLRALAFARASRPTFLNAITVAVDEDAAVRLQDRWDEMDLPVPLTILDSPYRELVRPVMNHITNLRRRSPRDLVIVYIPQYIVGRRWENLLHNQTSLRLKSRLLFVPNVVVASVPWRLRSFTRARDQLIRRAGDIDAESFRELR
nr:APC family permease [Brevibacterium ihuae]